jgi:hypothetical protein
MLEKLGPAFRVPKASGTHGDVLLAVGLADLLTAASGASPRIVESAGGFCIEVERPLGEADLERVPRDAGYEYLCPNAKSRAKVPKEMTNYLDYKQESQRAARYYEARTGLRRGGKTGAEIAEAIQQDRPRPDWRRWQALNNLQGDETSNRVYVAIRKMDDKSFAAMLRKGIAAVQNGTPSGAALGASPVQIFTPQAAKGYARLKPDGTDRNDKTVAAWSDDFAEWLRYRGYFACACPRLLGKDVRVVVPVPADISVRALRQIVLELLEVPLGSAKPMVDVFATLELARLLISHSQEYWQARETGADDVPLFAFAGRSPAAVVSGVHVTHYQSMGSAKAVSGASLLTMPGWFPVRESEEALQWLAILEEHRAALRALDPDHGDELGLLAAYRRFLQSRSRSATAAFVDFLGQYGSFRMRALSQRRRARAFQTDNVRRILMGTSESLSTVLDDPAFEAIADAVRKATVSAQAMKAMKKPDYREIRYGLLDDLRRTRQIPGARFVECVADFVAKYNAENAKRRERGKQAPRNVTTDELAAFVKLVELHTPAVVGALLAAYASCKKSDDADDAALDTAMDQT